MFAIVKTGGKQYKVQPDDIIKIEKIEGKEGSVVVLDEVIFVEDGKTTKVGAENSKGYGVAAEILEQKKDDKIIVFKKKRRHNYRRKKGHRQDVTVVKIKEVGKDLKPGKGSSDKKVAEKKETVAKSEKKETKSKPAAKKAAGTKK